MRINPELLKQAALAVKYAAVVAGDPAMAAQGGMPPGGDPAAQGGMPPGMDPAQMGAPPPGAMPPGMDPAQMGAAPPPPQDPMEIIGPMIQQAVQQAMQQQGGSSGSGGGSGASSSGGGSKIKIDINVELMQIKKLLAKLCDAAGISIPAADMVVTDEDVNNEAQGKAEQPPASALGSISPIQPVKAAEWEYGTAFVDDGLAAARRNTRTAANLAAAALSRLAR